MVRFRPMLLTAAAVLVGSLVMLADPIFQGLAISLMAGEVAATQLSFMAVPLLYFLLARMGRAAELQREGARDLEDAAPLAPVDREDLAGQSAAVPLGVARVGAARSAS